MVIESEERPPHNPTKKEYTFFGRFRISIELPGVIFKRKGNTYMNTETIKNDWNETKSKMKARFGKLTDDTIESLKGNLDGLSSKLQSAYSYPKDQADKESMSFKSTLSTPDNKSEKIEAPKVEKTA